MRGCEAARDEGVRRRGSERCEVGRGRTVMGDEAAKWRGHEGARRGGEGVGLGLGGEAARWKVQPEATYAWEARCSVHMGSRNCPTKSRHERVGARERPSVQQAE